MTAIDRRHLLKGAATGIGLLAAGRAAAGGASPPVPAAAAAPRRVERLADGWRFRLGHAADMAKDFGFGRDQRTFAKAGRAAPAAMADFDDSGWQAVRVPHDWAVDLPYAPPPRPLPEDRADAAAAHGFKALGRDFPGNSIGWYRHPLAIEPGDLGRSIWLEFDGVFRDARIFVNGYAVAREASGYAPFTVDIADFLDYSGGPNLLALRVDATLGEGWFYEGAGIYRHVRLVRADAVHVPRWGVFVRSGVDPQGATVRAEVRVANVALEARAVTLRQHVLGPDGARAASFGDVAVDLAAEAEATAAGTVRIAAPQLWSIEAPHLYRLVTELLVGGETVDRVETRFGIRTIRFDPERGFFLNGRSVKLLGTCNHHDHAGVGVAIPDRLHAWRIEQLQAMGSNAWRSAHNPPAPALLEMCDAKGMLIVPEARLNSTSEQAMDELERMVLSARNSPSVILWSVGNEEPHQASALGARISAEMGRRIARLDPTRPNTQAFDSGFGQGASRAVDVVGFNYRTDRIPLFHAAHPQVPVYGSETGSTVSTRGAYADDAAGHVVRAYDSEHPWWATTAEEWWTIADAHPYIAGGFVWTGFDYRGEPTPFPAWPSVSSYFGVMDLCGFPKDNYHYYRCWWRPGEPRVHLLPHWTWPGREGQPIEVWAYGNCEEVELALNGRSLGRKRMARGGHLAWQVPYAPGRIEARGYRGGRRVAADRRETAGPPARLVLVPDRRGIAADGSDLAMLRLEVTDSAGRLVPDDDLRVRFAVEGPGRLIGVGNGDPTDRDPDHAASRRSFHGLAQAIVQSVGTAGAIRVTASADGVRSAGCVLLATAAG